MDTSARSIALAVAILLLEHCSASAEPVATYLFDEGQGQVALDESGHGNNGEIVGATYVADTPFPDDCNFALQFSNSIMGPADDYVTIPDSPTLRPGELTIEARIKPVHSQGRHIVAKQLGVGQGDSYVFGSSLTRP